MINKEPFIKSSYFWRNLIVFVILLTLLGLFWELSIGGFRSALVIALLLSRYKFLILNSVNQQLFLNELKTQTPLVSFYAIFVVFVILLSTWLIFRLTIFVVAQFTLPINTWDERNKARKSLMSFALGSHGPAIFIKEGKQIARKKDIESSRPGVILVDLSSAVVLSQQENTQSWNLGRDSHIVGENLKKKTVEKKKTRSQFTISKGPGIVFTENGNKIFGVLDLRKQSRSVKDIEAYTRNGIKIKTTVKWIGFFRVEKGMS